jgi:hypothetical protein
MIGIVSVTVPPVEPPKIAVAAASEVLFQDTSDEPFHQNKPDVFHVPAPPPLELSVPVGSQ